MKHGAMGLRGAIVMAVVLASAGCAHRSPYEPADPLEAINRPVFSFNMTADRYVLRPVAKTYAAVVPSAVRTGIYNFFENLFYPTVIVNDLLQGKFVQASRDTARFVMNSTYGLAGFLDPATMVGLEKNNEDLGQTLGRWGVGEGWYLMLPILGPTTNRDLIGRVGDNWTDPLQYVESIETGERIVLTGIQAIDGRSRLLYFDAILEQQFDPYVFMRTAYLERRLNQVYDGKPPLELLEPELPED
jgi:phospholipid-binding lipoprotein MlaA